MDNGEFEFIELKNIGDETLDLTHVTLTFDDELAFDFAGGSIPSLPPGDFVLLVRNRPVFLSRYESYVPGIAGIITGEYTLEKLSNGGEVVRLTDFWNGTIVEFEYNDSRGWPLAANGGGHSLVPLEAALPDEPLGSLDYSGNWRASAYRLGSPAQDDPAPPVGVVINEVMAHTDYSVPPYDSNDWIELYNMGASSVSLNHHWYLSDDIENLTKWALPTTALAGYSRMSFDEVTGFHNPITSGFGLNKAGEEVFLSYLPGTQEDRIVDWVRFKGQETEVSLGRDPDGGAYLFPMIPSRDSTNIPALPDIVLSEIMYHPPEDTAHDEYIELYNPTVVTVPLENTTGSWRLDGIGSTSYYFPRGPVDLGRGAAYRSRI